MLAAGEIADHALKRLLDLVAAAAIDEAQGDGLAAGAVEDDVSGFLGQVLPRHVELESVGARERAQHLHVIGAGRVGLGPGDDRALADRERVVGDDEVLVEHQFLAEAVARRASALRRVEREQARLDLGDGEAGDRAGEFLGEGDAAKRCVVLQNAPLRGFLERFGDAGALAAARVLGRVGGVEISEAVGELQCGLKTVGEPRFDPLPDDDAVDDHLDVVLVFLVERRRFLDRVEDAVDADALEARLLPIGELLPVLALAAADDGGEEIVPRAFRQRHHAIDHLADLLRLDRQPRGGRIRHADARPQQAQIVVDFGDRGDGRARVAAGGLLLDRDGGREAVDMLDVGLLHHLEELAGVGA